ncbi:hypothetical protein PRIPAC_86753 [Pristionchus pacificus]|uniref:Uncharacterized protein n=1 Tax=Pristionchus pacificus TaxID=54126 RepID=A0A2A6BUZ9_PRIPA|nr:hypothetical protein PRIPAC_86753 [Pristionchus pacificus]|eukprot:PDM69688.1 hypothetical protein PRIPAC_44784 [Pristionchus pacificus]
MSFDNNDVLANLFANAIRSPQPSTSKAASPPAARPTLAHSKSIGAEHRFTWCIFAVDASSSAGRGQAAAASLDRVLLQLRGRARDALRLVVPPSDEKGRKRLASLQQQPVGQSPSPSFPSGPFPRFRIGHAVRGRVVHGFAVGARHPAPAYRLVRGR